MFENWILQTFAHVRPFPDMSAMLSENLLQCNMKARGSNVGAGFPFPSHLPLIFFIVSQKNMRKRFIWSKMVNTYDNKPGIIPKFCN